jgi:hypothetical protein
MTVPMTTVHATMSGLTTRTENLGHKLYMDSFSSFPDLFDNFYMRSINCCGTVRPNGRGIANDSGAKLRMKLGDIETIVMGDLTAVVWNDKT